MTTVMTPSIPTIPTPPTANNCALSAKIPLAVSRVLHSNDPARVFTRTIHLLGEH